ncbi:MAG: hypothetical protein O6943_06440 [Bacteroidetes bacterium]|nr:hypothetical protein [Bacteroidota bacterium]
MKFIYSILCLSIVFAACEEKHEYHDDSAHEKFVKNSETAMANIKNWESETPDYSQYAADFVSSGTAYGAKDSISLDDMKKKDEEILAMFDFRIASDSINLLPGVDPETKKMDGSVRYYLDWEVTLPATDSTEARSGIIHFYEYFVFNDDGKIIDQAGYGDFGGLMGHLHGDDDGDGDEDYD